jgi:hypothetical protein
LFFYISKDSDYRNTVVRIWTENHKTNLDTAISSSRVRLSPLFVLVFFIEVVLLRVGFDGLIDFLYLLSLWPPSVK